MNDNLKLDIRKKVLDVSKQLQNETIKSLRLLSEELQESAMEQEEYSADQLMSKRHEMMEDAERNEKQMALANEYLTALSKIDPSDLKQEITYGAIVFTNHQNFLVAVSNGKLSVDGKDFIGISTEAPIYKTMVGKKKGDKFSFNGRDYAIEEIC